MPKRILILIMISLLLVGCMPASTSEETLEELNEKTNILYENMNEINGLNLKIKKLEESSNTLNAKMSELEKINTRLTETITEKEEFIDKLLADLNTSTSSINNENYLLKYYRQHFLPSISPNTAEKSIATITKDVIMFIESKDMNSLSSYIHPTLGIRFTPYTTVSLDNDLVLTKENITNFFSIEEEYLWGYYDGSGEEIRLTPAEYYSQFIYNHDFKNVEDVGYNEVLIRNNNIENQFAFYHDSIIVEYKFPGTEALSYLDFASIRLVYQFFDNKWYLVGLIHNQWTI